MARNSSLARRADHGRHDAKPTGSERTTAKPTGGEPARHMREATRAYGGPWNAVRDGLSTASRENYTWFTSHVVDAPWNRGRTVIIGPLRDQAHLQGHSILVVV